MKRIGLVIGLLFLACGGDDDGDMNQADDGDADDGDVDAGEMPPLDGPTVGEYVPLVTATWTLEPGTEAYICGTRTLTEDIYAGALRPIAPPGTHHTTVALRFPGEPDDPSFPCGAEFGDFWASGVGTGELVLPDGVGLLAPAGRQLRINLHLFNATDQPMSGTSGLEVLSIDPAEVEHTARVDYHGPLGFVIPANGMPHPETNLTPLPAGTLVGIFPHMHQLGTHFRAALQRPGEDPIVLWDEDYQFESQEFAPLSEVQVQDGDALETTCTWVNDTKADVFWGDSSEAEMCFTILMTY